MGDIEDIVTWLKRQRDAALPISNAGARAGENRARELGLRARSDQSQVQVDYRGRRSMASIPPAIHQGMLEEWNRRAQ